jgi:hypothetical protein
MIFRQNSFKTIYNCLLSPGSIFLMWSGFNNTKSPLLNPLSLETQKKKPKVRPHSIPCIWRCHHCRWRTVNLGLCYALRAFKQGGIFILPHLLWHGVSVFPVSFEEPPHSVASYNTRGCGGFIQTRILMGPHSVASYDTQDLFLPGSSWVHTREKFSLARRKTVNS